MKMNCFVIAGLLLAGCSDSEIDVRNAIINWYGLEAVPLPGSSYYVVRDTNGVIWAVSTRNNNIGTTTTNFMATKIFEAK